MSPQDSADFEYIDLWSSRHTWGGAAPPVDGDFVVIPTGMNILLDVDTAVLKMLLIQGKQSSVLIRGNVSHILIF